MLGYLCSRYFIKSLFRIADSTRTSKRGGNDPKICEILVDNVESKDLGAWRSNLFSQKRLIAWPAVRNYPGVLSDAYGQGLEEKSKESM